MSFLSGLRGVLALMTRAPATQFSNFFGAPKQAFQNSLAAIGGSVLLMMVAARNIIHMPVSYTHLTLPTINSV